MRLKSIVNRPVSASRLASRRCLTWARVSTLGVCLSQVAPITRLKFSLVLGHSRRMYSLLHLSGYELSIDDLKNFRQLHSKTPGHPEYGSA
ncbi:hypothetical protein KIN38_21220, partial [Vibrio sp. B511a]|nr:hypothetical protein [Vibrio sp. B511a]